MVLLTLGHVFIPSHKNPAKGQVLPGSFLSQCIEEGVRVEKLSQIEGVR